MSSIVQSIDKILNSSPHENELYTSHRNWDYLMEFPVPALQEEQ